MLIDWGWAVRINLKLLVQSLKIAHSLHQLALHPHKHLRLQARSSLPRLTILQLQPKQMSLLEHLQALGLIPHLSHILFLALFFSFFCSKFDFRIVALDVICCILLKQAGFIPCTISIFKQIVLFTCFQQAGNKVRSQHTFDRSPLLHLRHWTIYVSEQNGKEI